MKKLVVVCMALVMALGLAACGGSGSSSSAPAASSGAVSAPAASGTSASEADDGIAMTGGNVEEHSVEAIKAKGVLVVTTEAGYAPFEFLDENDNVVGLDASLAQALADDLGVELDIQNIAFDSVVAEVQAGNADMAIAGLTPNADRKKSVDMSDMYYAGGQMEAARCIGMSHWKAMRHVILPQAVRNILPAMCNEFVTIIKETSILGMVGIVELMFRAQSIAKQTYIFLEPYVIAAIMYFIIVFPLSKIIAAVERRMSKSVTR